LKNKTQIPSNVAILRVEKSEPVAVNGKTFYENTVKLITGRTHQIRAQFSKENLALINDCLYLNANDGETAPPRVPEPEEKIGLHALSLKINAETSLGPKGVEFRAKNDIWWRSS
jgi:23S rRNA-/tRNA-specific pseudouridylate synthase